MTPRKKLVGIKLEKKERFDLGLLMCFAKDLCTVLCYGIRYQSVFIKIMNVWLVAKWNGNARSTMIAGTRMDFKLPLLLLFPRRRCLQRNLEGIAVSILLFILLKQGWIFEHVIDIEIQLKLVFLDILFGMGFYGVF